MSASSQAVRCKTVLLQQLASQVNVSVPDSAEVYREVGMFRGHPIVAACDSNHVVKHLGLKFFNLQMHYDVPPNQRLVMDFLERYCLDLQTQTGTTIQRKMDEDKFLFRKGTLTDLMHVADTMAFSINFIDRYYEVSWTKDGEPFVIVAFPAQYELLLGMPLTEIQQKVKEELRSARPRRMTMEDVSQLQPLDDSIYMVKTDYFQLESVNDATYYYKAGGDHKPVFDSHHPDYSAANLVLGLIADDDYRMHIEQSVYGMTSINYMVSFRQWLNLCAEQGLKVYFGIEEEREDGLLALVIAQNKELGYNHLLSLVIPDRFTESRSVVFKGKLTAYIPTHNVKNLYQQPSERKERIKWQ